MTSPCAFPGCPNPKSPKAGKGLCSSHYWQLHKGRPLTPLAYRRNQCIPWLEAHIAYEGDDCLKWPFSPGPNGYGQVLYQGKNQPANRAMCDLAHGHPPTPEHEAAHSCGNGHLGCVNPKHLRWATTAENHADMIEHGTAIRGEKAYNAKLTAKAVKEIRALAGKLSQSKIGALYGIQQTHAGRIIRGERWGHVA